MISSAEHTGRSRLEVGGGRSAKNRTRPHTAAHHRTRPHTAHKDRTRTAHKPHTQRTKEKVPNAGGNVTEKFWKRQWLHSRGEFPLSDILARAERNLPDPPVIWVLLLFPDSQNTTISIVPVITYLAIHVGHVEYCTKNLAKLPLLRFGASAPGARDSLARSLPHSRLWNRDLKQTRMKHKPLVQIKTQSIG
jgi:hypothetical protein